VERTGPAGLKVDGNGVWSQEWGALWDGPAVLCVSASMNCFFGAPVSPRHPPRPIP
jgi:hypothetical protein